MSTGKLGELLVSKGVVTPQQLDEATQHSVKNRSRLSSSLIQLKHVNEKVLATFLSKHYGITAISLDGVTVPAEVVKRVPHNLCEKHCMVPLSIEGNRVNIALSDPSNVSAVDDIRFLCNLDVTVYIATESSIKSLIAKCYNVAPKKADENELMSTDLNEDEEKEGQTQVVEIGAAAEAHEIEQDNGSEKPVIRIINKLFVEAISRKCSDIHIEPFEAFSRVRFRIDGSLHEIMRLPPQLKNATPARIKVMAQLDISEKRLPQDGRIQVRTKTRKIDIRVSVLPTMYGEKIVMRLLDSGSSTPDLKTTGYEEEQYKLFRKAAEQPYGMILVTGPTGSGKSTTLYGILTELNQPDVNISTVEDPVEYRMTGINQVQMRENIGLTFASALRSLLRQDPDIVMVGEIRDQETAEIAIKASLTGHMVFSTLHTNDAPSTITRLIHMGVEPFLITASLTLVQAQRLVRRLCDQCAEVDPRITPEMLLDAEVPEHWLETIRPLRAKGCDVCGTTGFKGRKGVFEVMYLTERLRDMIIKGANADALKIAAMEEGMLSLRQSALLKMYRGETTLEEVLNNSRPDKDLRKAIS